MDSDGREDYAIGAYSSAYIFYDTVTAGSYDPTTVASVTLTSGDTCVPGQQLAYGGDLDGDGVDDLLVPCALPGSSVGARSFVISGALRRLTVEAAGGQTGDTTILGTSNSGTEYGYSVASGDFNDDGFADVVAGDISAGTYGSAKLHLGPFAATERASTPDGVYTTPLQSDYNGWAISGPGSLNSDSYDDFIIGGPLHDTSVGSDAGKVYLLSGASAGYSADLSTVTYVSGAAAGDQFGYDVAIIGDGDGDTYSEFIVGAPYQDNPAVDAGRVYYYSAPITASAQAADGILKGEATLDHLGWAVAGGRDLDGDGFDDFIVSAPDNDAVASAAGKAYLFLNPPSGTVNATTADAFFRGAAASDQFGYDVAMAEDVNGDGTDDLIIGAPGNDDAGSGYGKAYLWWGEAFSGTYATSSADESIVGTYTNDGIGYRVAGAGDINQDGYGEVLAAGPMSSDFATNAGKVMYVHGPVTNRTPFIWFGATASDEAGRALAAVDDQDLNGFPEYAIGSQDAYGNLYGEVYIRQGGTSNR